MNDLHPLGHAKYLSLRTFRKSGKAVDTPIWFADMPEGGMCGFSAGEAGKVKRLRNNSTVQVACCDFKGSLLGEWQAADCQILRAPEHVAAALSALRKKYGWQMHMADIGARLTAKFNKRAYLRITLESP